MRARLHHGHLRRIVLTAILALGALRAHGQSIVTVAGGGTEEGRPGTVVALNEPVAIVADGAGNLYVGERQNHRVRKIAAGSGITTVVAGNGLEGFAGDGGSARDAKITTPDGLALDSKGHLFIADRENQRIRSVDLTSGLISTVAGSSASGFGGDGGPATTAKLNYPQAVAVDAAGNVYIADWFNNRIRKIDAASGIISTVAGSGSNTFSGDNGPATAAGIDGADCVIVDASGNLYVAEVQGFRVRKVSAGSGIITTVAGNGTAGFSGDGGPATSAQLYFPNGLSTGADGSLYIADAGNGRVRKVTSNGAISSLAIAPFSYPIDVAIEGTTSLAIADSSRHRVYRVDLSTLAVNSIAGNGSTSFSGDGGPATAATFNSPLDLTAVGADLYVAESGKIRKISANGLVTTAAAVPGSNVAADTAGNLYYVDFNRNLVRKIPAGSNQIVTVAGTGQSGDSGDGGPATAARLSNPNQVTIDASGNLLIADFGNDRIRRVDATSGIITTVAGNGTGGFSGDGGAATAAMLSGPRDVAIDGQGSLYIADSFNDRIRKVSAQTGIISTLAGNGMLGSSGDGGPATAASLYLSQVSVDSLGTVYVPDDVSDRVRRVDPVTGIISTIAGTGQSGYSGDNGPASLARLDYPSSVAIDRSGNLFIADTFNDRIRRVFSCGSVPSPALITPSNDSRGVSLAPAMRWSPAANALRYDVLLGETNPPQTTVASDIEATSFSPANLMPQTTYYWRIVAKGDQFCAQPLSTASAVQHFTTTSACQVPGNPTAATP